MKCGGRARLFPGGARDSRAVSGDSPETLRGVRDHTQASQICAPFRNTSISNICGQWPQTAPESGAPPGSRRFRAVLMQS